MKPTIGFVTFGEVNTPFERLQLKHDGALEILKALPITVVDAGIVIDDTAYETADAAIAKLKPAEFDCLLVCAAGWVPTHAVVRVTGGNMYAASSVKVYLTYNTAAATDVDLAKGAVDGTTGISAVSVGGDLTALLTFVGMGFGNAGQVIIARYIGAGRRDKLGKFVGTMTSFLLLSAVVIPAREPLYIRA